MMVFLTGFMGCGKSSIGKQAAAEMGCGFCDTDRLIEEETGLSIEALFSRHGEEGFRSLERQILHRICSEGYSQERAAIIATGGGMPCSEENMTLMKQSGLTIYMHMSVGKLFDRLSAGRRRRPKISGLSEKELFRFIEIALAERERFYSRADVTIECDNLSDGCIAKRIAAIIAARLQTTS